MGYYIETDSHKGKAAYLVKQHSGQIVSQQASFADIPEGKAIICVVDNGPFEAAGYCFSAREFQEFARFDGRSKQWVLLDVNIARELSGYKLVV